MTAVSSESAPSASASPAERRISRRIGSIAESATLAVDAKAKALKAAGKPVIGFGAGEPDFPTPGLHRRGGRRRLPPARDAPVHPGRRAARAQGGDRRQDRAGLGLQVTAANVLVTNGGKQAVYEALATMLDPGDEVLLPAPYWTTYPEAIRLAGGVPVPVVADEQSGYLVSVGQLEAARTPRTKVLLFCSPSNPTGAVYPPEQVEEIGRWALDAGLWVLTDEIYEHLTYGGVSAPSMPVRGARAGRPLRRRQRGGQDLCDDRLAGGLDRRARPTSSRRRPTCSRTPPPTSPTCRRPPRSPR